MDTVYCVYLHMAFICKIVVKAPDVRAFQINDFSLAEVRLNKHSVHILVIRESVVFQSALELYPTVVQIIDSETVLVCPQNPSGYSPTVSEAKEIVRIVRELAEAGKKVLVLSDDAYFGLNYEDDIEPQSLFAYMADLHENVLAIKADGPTKEDFAWGFRAGFVTFASKGLSDTQYTALVTKFMAAIRSSVSCSSTPSQSLVMHALKDEAHEKQKLECRSMLKRRYDLVRKFVNTHTSKVLEPLPFNSGYFMSFHVSTGKAEEIRKELLKKEGIGIIQIDPHTLRVAFSSIDEDKIDSVYTSIYNVADAL